MKLVFVNNYHDYMYIAQCYCFSFYINFAKKKKMESSFIHPAYLHSISRFMKKQPSLFFWITQQISKWVSPVKRLAIEVVVPNWVSRYLGRNTTKPLTMAISQHIPRQVTRYTSFFSKDSMERGMSGSRGKTLWILIFIK